MDSNIKHITKHSVLKQAVQHLKRVAEHPVSTSISLFPHILVAAETEAHEFSPKTYESHVCL